MKNATKLIGLTAALLCSGPAATVALAQVEYELYKPHRGPYEIHSASELELNDDTTETTLPIRVTYPDSKRDANSQPFPVIVFSHGAGRSKDNYLALTEYWASHGYVCIQPTHDDSLSLLSREQRRENRNLREFVSRSLADYQLTRPRDVQLILDQLPQIERAVSGLDGMLDSERIGMGGHSFGAHTTQLIGGLSLVNRRSNERATYDDPRPNALLLISPQGTGGQIDRDSWKDMERPAMVVTGTNDRGRNGQSHQWRLEVFEHLPPPDKYLTFIEEAHHELGGISGARYSRSDRTNDEHVEYVKSSSLAFWDAYLKEDQSAMEFLRSD